MRQEINASFGVAKRGLVGAGVAVVFERGAATGIGMIIANYAMPDRDDPCAT